MQRSRKIETSSLSAPKTARSLDRSVVLVRGVSETRSLTLDGMFLADRRLGHGFVVERGRDIALIVTAAHVLRGKLPEVSDSLGGPFLPAEIVRVDAATDLALLRVSKRALPGASALGLEPSGRLRPGGLCWVVNAERGIDLLDGNSLGQPADARELIADFLGAEPASADWFLVSQAGHRGLSGAPVLASSGRVAGVLIGGIELPNDPDVSIIMGPQAIASLLEGDNDRP